MLLAVVCYIQIYMVIIIAHIIYIYNQLDVSYFNAV
jgi:hypothetical protein